MMKVGGVTATATHDPSGAERIPHGLDSPAIKNSGWNVTVRRSLIGLTKKARLYVTNPKKRKRNI